MQKLLAEFPGLATSGRHNSAMFIDAKNSLPNEKSLYSSFHFNR